MRPDRFPLTFDECRERFRWGVTNAILRSDAHPITARGLHGQELTIDVTTIGAAGACADRVGSPLRFDA